MAAQKPILRAGIRLPILMRLDNRAGSKEAEASDILMEVSETSWKEMRERFIRHWQARI